MNGGKAVRLDRKLLHVLLKTDQSVLTVRYKATVAKKVFGADRQYCKDDELFQSQAVHLS